MAGVTKLQKIQLGAEGTPGTAVAATAIWRGKGGLRDTTEVNFVDESVGYLSPLDRTYIAAVGGELTMDSIEATFEQLGYILMAGVKSVSGVVDGAGSDYIWTFTFPTTAANTIKTYTLEGGDDQQAEEMAYCFVTNFGLTGAVNEAVMTSATWIGRQISTTTFSSPALPTIEEILFNKGKLYIDAVTGSYGGTIKSNTLVSMNLDVDTGLRAYTAADGNLYFSAQKSIGPQIILDLTFEHDATAVAEIANWRAETPRLIQLKFEGSNVVTPGTTYSKKTLIVNVAGIWTSFGTLTDRDGNDVVTGTFQSAYDPTDATFAEIIVVNELSALP